MFLLPEYLLQFLLNQPICCKLDHIPKHWIYQHGFDLPFTTAVKWLNFEYAVQSLTSIVRNETSIMSAQTVSMYSHGFICLLFLTKIIMYTIEVSNWNSNFKSFFFNHFILPLCNFLKQNIYYIFHIIPLLKLSIFCFPGEKILSFFF